ncbi:hypothetical protein V6N12_011755 [Hibiscus sabdariffa]|uniref:Uncharacterized protein n=1 Tax=Hibiscus sabdariffa TaxID=183260 RepID=A0ABR2BTK4_9ROSI
MLPLSRLLYRGKCTRQQHYEAFKERENASRQAAAVSRLNNLHNLLALLIGMCIEWMHLKAEKWAQDLNILGHKF